MSTHRSQQALMYPAPNPEALKREPTLQSAVGGIVLDDGEAADIGDDLGFVRVAREDAVGRDLAHPHPAIPGIRPLTDTREVVRVHENQGPRHASAALRHGPA
ncbi:MAG: hypothetical protein ACTH31_14385 [Pseudoclavibacter sp.]